MKLSAFCVILFALFHQAARPEAATSVLQLRSGDKQVSISDAAKLRLQDQVTELIRSSLFHSGPDDKNHLFTLGDVHQRYRDSVATGDYLLLILSPARKIHTQGGEVYAAEIIVGLRVTSVFSIDEAGAIMAHGKCNGGMWLELKKTVEQSRP